MDVGRLLDIGAFRYPDKMAVVCRDKRWTYRQLQERVRRLSSAFLHLGVKKGDRVGAVMWNCSEVVEIYLAAVRIGAIFTPLNFRFALPELKYVLSDASPSVLIVDEKCQDLAQGAVSDKRLFECLYSISSGNLGGLKPYRDLMEKSPPFDKSLPIAGSDPCSLLYTSGTTGKPKGVLLSHDNINWNSINMIQVRHDHPDDVALILGPMFHVGALNSHYSSRLAIGGTAVIMDKFDPTEMMETIQRESITVVSGAPTMYIMLMEACKPGDYDTSSVHTLTSGADKFPLQTQMAIREYFPKIEGVYDIYGMTEATCVTGLEARDSIRKFGSVGPPLPFCEVKLLNDQEKEVATGQIGEIVLRGPNVMMGYYNLPEETEKALKDGWYYSGDMGYADDEGFIYIADRKKDIIISGAENIIPKEVEEILYTHPDVLKVGVFGVPDAKWGERVVAAILPRGGRIPTLEEIREHAKKHLAGYKIPREIMIVDKLPEASVGKVQKQKLRKMYEERLQEK